MPKMRLPIPFVCVVAMHERNQRRPRFVFDSCAGRSSVPSRQNVDPSYRIRTFFYFLFPPLTYTDVHDMRG
jgi:hypothetical protein